jgi:hypothetical protein
VKSKEKHAAQKEKRIRKVITFYSPILFILCVLKVYRLEDTLLKPLESFLFCFAHRKFKNSSTSLS